MHLLQQTKQFFCLNCQLYVRNGTQRLPIDNSTRDFVFTDMMPCVKSNEIRLPVINIWYKNKMFNVDCDIDKPRRNGNTNGITVTA